MKGHEDFVILGSELHNFLLAIMLSFGVCISQQNQQSFSFSAALTSILESLSDRLKRTFQVDSQLSNLFKSST